MKCPGCGREPADYALLESPCTCGAKWIDTADYVRLLADHLDVKTVLDVGCGNKGVIAQHYWERERKIEHGYACDRWVIKPLPPVWSAVLDDAERLESLIKPVDVITHCGFLEHLDYEKAFRVLHVLERLAKKLIFFTCSAELRQVDYKVKKDGNPYHYYRSFWDGATFEALGYRVDRARMASSLTFSREVVGWVFFPGAFAGWEYRVGRAREHIASRRCCVPGCNAEPLIWAVEHGDACYCCVHYVEKFEKPGDVRWWTEQKPSVVDELLRECTPPWRKEKLLGRLP